MKLIRVQIEAVDDEGRGRGIFNDPQGHEFDVAVRGAFLSDDVLVNVERTFAVRGLLVGRATEFFHRGDCHTKRSCPHEAPCPACPLHGTDPSLEFEIKRGRIESALHEAGISFDVDDVVPHPQQFGYRQKVKLMAQRVDSQLRLGVYIPYSHRFVVAEQCPYVCASINHAITQLLDLLNGIPTPMDLAHIKAIVLRAGKNGVACVIVATQSLSEQVINALKESVERGHLLSAVERVQTTETNSILSGDIHRRIGPTLIEPLEGGPMVDPDSFCQSDPDQATFMYDVVAEFLTSDGSDGRFLDAYAGVGGFTRALLRRNVKDVIAVEQSQSALSALNQLGVQVILTPMYDALQSLIAKKPFQGIVVDPPKKGLMDDAQAIAQLNAKRLVLVSCDPDAMAKDLRVFIQHGYVVQRILPIDFFGGTPAIETIVFMSLEVN